MRAAPATLATLLVVGACSSREAAAPTTTIPPEIAAVTLAPPDAYPVIDAADAADADLAPGIYRVRLSNQATWPPQCLDEMIVFPTPAGTAAPSTGGTSAPASTLDPNWEEMAIARQDRIRELRGAICQEYYDGNR